MATVQLSISTNTLWCIENEPKSLDATYPQAVHSASPAPLTEEGPLGALILFFPVFRLGKAGFFAHLKFENRSIF